MDENRNNEIVKSMMELDFRPTDDIEASQLTRYTRLPTGDAALAGGARASLLPVFRTITSTMALNEGDLYRAILPKGATLAAMKDGSGFIGAAVRQGEGVAGQARFVPAGGAVQMATTTVSVDPVTLGIAIAMVEIDMKLDAIQKTQQEMFDYLKARDEAELHGDITSLSDIMDSYRLNSTNERFKSEKRIEVQDIRRDADRKIEQYRMRLEGQLRKDGPLHLGMDVDKKAEDVSDTLRRYQMSLFAYAYATFLEVMLRENFESEFLRLESDKIDKRALRYRKDYTHSYDWIERFSHSTVEDTVIRGFATAAEGLGEFVEKSPIGGCTPINRGLKDAGNGVENFLTELSANTMKSLLKAKEPVAAPFLENIRNIDATYNEPLELLVSSDGTYVRRLLA